MKEDTTTAMIDAAVRALAAGRLVAIPTETVYGLAADATQPEAVAEVFRLKGRPVDHPLIVHCASAEQAWECGREVPESARMLAAACWPGPLTLVLERSTVIGDNVTGGQTSVAVRVPAHPLTLRLLTNFGRPLVAPSANRFGRVSPTTAAHVEEEFPDADLLILDGGPCQVGIESTIVDARDGQRLKILRPGKLTREDLEPLLTGTGVRVEIPDTAAVRISGNLPSHYAPAARVVLVEPGELERWLKTDMDLRGGSDRTLVVATSEKPDGIPDELPWCQLPADVSEFARQMYALFRQADRAGMDRILVQLPPARGIGLALRDRLHRAAQHRSD